MMNPAARATIAAQNTRPRLNPKTSDATINPSATNEPTHSAGPRNEKSFPEVNTAAVRPPNTRSVTNPAWSGKDGLPTPYFGFDAIVRSGTNTSVYRRTYSASPAYCTPTDLCPWAMYWAANVPPMNTTSTSSQDSRLDSISWVSCSARPVPIRAADRPTNASTAPATWAYVRRMKATRSLTGAAATVSR